MCTKFIKQIPFVDNLVRRKEHLYYNRFLFSTRNSRTISADDKICTPEMRIDRIIFNKNQYNLKRFTYRIALQTSKWQF